MLPVSELTIIVGPSIHQRTHADALAAGAKRHGVTVTYSSSFNMACRTKHVACWGWRYGKRLRERGKEVLVMERGYIGDRFAWTSLGWNGLNNRATWYPKDTEARFWSNFGHLLQPWKDGGEYVLLIGQVPGDASLGGMDLSAWYEKAARAAKAAYGLPVRFRPHPQAVHRNQTRHIHAAQRIDGTLAEALAGAAIVVVFNSNTAVESVLAGVPTVAMDKGTMAYEMCGTQIGETRRPERGEWAERLAWCQWTMDEIKSGEAWDAVRPR